MSARRMKGTRPTMSKEAAGALSEASSALVWTGRCRVCGEELAGTPASLRAHVHVVVASDG